MHHLGLTRSAHRRDHLLLTPDTFVRTPLPGLTSGMAIVHISPELGAGFAQLTLQFDAGGALHTSALPPAQRLIYVLSGTLTLASADGEQTLAASGFAYLPQGTPVTLTAAEATRAVLIDKVYEPLADIVAPQLFTGSEATLQSTALNGDEALQVRALLPADAAHDFACNTMSYQPGASLAQVEVHVMEHGLLMLEGGGIYRLGDAWYPVEAGDVIWMAPYCPQWFCAVGKVPAKYLIYKNFNRAPTA